MDDEPNWITNMRCLDEYVRARSKETPPQNPDIVENKEGIIGMVLRREGSETEWIYSDYIVDLDPA